MNNWLALALSAALSWAVVNVLDKIIIDKRVKIPGSFLILNAIIGLVPATVAISLSKLDSDFMHIL